MGKIDGHISRRQFLRLVTAGTTAALVPEVVGLSVKAAEQLSTTDIERNRQRLAEHFVVGHSEFSPFQSITNPDGFKFNIADPPRNVLDRQLKLLTNFRPAFLTTETTGVFSYTVTPEQLQQLQSAVEPEFSELIARSFVVKSNEDVTQRSVVILDGDSFTLWRNWPFLLQKALSLAGKNIDIKVSADYGTGALEALARLQHGNVIKRQPYPTKIIHLLSPATDFVIDIRKAMSKATESHPPISITQTIRSVFRRMYREFSNDLDIEPRVTGSYIPEVLNDPQNKSYREISVDAS